MGFEQAQIKSLTLNKFKGLNSNGLSSTIKENESQDCSNIIYYDGSLTTPPGFVRHSAQIGGSSSTTAVTGIWDFQQRDGDRVLVVSTEDNIYYFDAATNLFTSIVGALTVTDFNTRFISFNDRVVATNYNDVPWTWNGAGNAVTLHSLSGATLNGTFKAKWVSTFNSRAVLANYIDTAGNYWPTSVAFSDLDDVLTWDLTNQTWEFETDDAQVITGIRQLGEKLVVYKSNSIGYVSGYGLQDWVVNRQWKKGVGCVSGDTLRSGYLIVEGILKEVHIFLSQGGLRALDEAGNVYFLPIVDDRGEYIVQEYFDSLNKADMADAVGAFYSKRNWYYSFHTDSDSSQNDKGSIYDHLNNSFWPLNGVRARCAAEVYNSTSGEWEVYIGTEDGIIYRTSETTKGFEASTELVTNGSMEADSDWTSYGTPTTNDRSAAQVYQGTWSRRCITDEVGEGIYQNISTTAGKQYIVYCYAFVSAGEVIIDAISSGSVSLATSSSATAASWTRLTATFTATTSTTSIVFRNTTTAASTFYIDDASVRCIDVNPYYESPYLNFGDEHTVKFLREFVPLATATDTGSLSMTVTYGKGASTTSSETFDVSSNIIDWADDINWASDINWDSYEELYADVENLTQDAFRTLKWRVSGTSGITDLQFNQLLLKVQVLGERPFNQA